MPINPSIALQLNPLPDPNAPMKGAYELAAWRQRIATGQAEAEQRQRALAEQQALDQSTQRHIIKNPDGTLSVDHNGLAADMAERGFGHAIPALQKSWTEADKEKANLTKIQGEIATNTQTLADKQDAANQAQINRMANLGYGISLAPDKAHALVMAKTAGLDPQHEAEITQRIHATQTPEELKALADPLWVNNQSLQERLDKQKTEDLTREEKQKNIAVGNQALLKNKINLAIGPLSQAARQGPQAFQAALSQQDPDVQKPFLSLGPNPTDADVVRAAATPGELLTAENQQAQRRLQQEGVDISRGQLGVAQARELREGQQAQASTGTEPSTWDQAYKNRLEDMFTGRLPLPPRGKAYDKTIADLENYGILTGRRFDQGVHLNRVATIKDYSSNGASGKALTRFDTAGPHLNEMWKLSNQMNIIDWARPLSADRRSYDTSADLAADEIGSMVKSNLLGQEEGKRLVNNFKSVSQDVRNAAIKRYGELMADKARAMATTYKEGTNDTLDLNKRVPHVVKALKDFGVPLEEEETPTGEAAPSAMPNVQQGRVVVIDKSGKKFTVPQSQLQDALSQGYRQAQ